ncbi:thioester reductase domain-containing protein [Halioglobus maricola]|nr:thioester reductase domain-containing protein [Halioglobus maricola]
MPDTNVTEQALQPGLSITEKLDLIIDGYSQRTALAERAYTLEPNGTRQHQQTFTGITYGEFGHRVRSLANAWRNNSEHSVEPDGMVFVIGFASIDYQVIDTACLYAQAVTVPMQSMTSGADLDETIANIDPATIAASLNDLEIATEHAIRHKGIKSLIVFDFEPQDVDDCSKYHNAEKMIAASGLPIALTSLQELIELGGCMEWEPLPPHPQGEERLAAIIHSSGSTGKPKGAMLQEKAIKKMYDTLLMAPRMAPQFVVCYAPLNHILGRAAVAGALLVGGICNFTLRPDMSSLFEDIRITEPTRLSFFPRVFELIYQQFQNEVAKRVRAGEKEDVASAQVKQEMGRNFLGTRLLTGSVGGAPTSAHVRQFMAECFEFRLLNSYGNTESGSGNIAIDGKISPQTIAEYKLRDVPELGYYTSDKPYPRGELCYKGTVSTSGYYKDPEATAELFDEEGFLLTGDIVEEIGSGHIAIIDRRKDVLKLSQGEYVALGQLQAKFESGSAAIRQIYLYGNSLQAYLLAVIVPDLEAVHSLIGADAAETDLDSFLRQEMQRVAREESIKSFEVPRGFIVEREPFSQENGLLSSVRKRLAPAFKKKYGERLEAIYAEHESRKDEHLQQIKDTTNKLSTKEKVCEVLKYLLNIENISPDSPGNFSDLGGDSLGAASFSLLLEEVFGVNIPADLLLSPTAGISRWAETIDRSLNGELEAVSYASIHGKGAEEVFASDLKVERFLIDTDLELARSSLPAVATEDEATFLLTGANGFLGRFVCVDLLKKASTVGGKVVCLIRAHDDASARSRLDEVFSAWSDVDASLENEYLKLASKHLEVLAGDIAEPDLGLDSATFRRLTEEVNRIVHVGALVNHKMSYPNLFNANVVGTAEIIKMALLVRKKPIDFVSSVAVSQFLDTSQGVNEEAPLQDSAQLSDFYASGYGLSKWAGEHLLQDAHAGYGIPVNVFRGEMMLAHESYAGHMNTDDMFTRLLFSVIETGLAPRSFYQLDSEGKVQSGHYNGLPVNVVAQAIVNGRNFNPDAYKLYYISNYHHDDGCSLDAFVDWIEAAGHVITRVDDHREWVQRFEQKLKALPDERKQFSALAIISAFSQPYPAGNYGRGCDNFMALMQQHYESGVPHLDQRFINKCLADMKVQGLVH